MRSASLTRLLNQLGARALRPSSFRVMFAEWASCKGYRHATVCVALGLRPPRDLTMRKFGYIIPPGEFEEAQILVNQWAAAHFV